MSQRPTVREIVDDVLRREGEFVQHPADAGGPTKFGITQATLADWRHAPVTASDVSALTIDELMRKPLEARKFKAGRSLRDVEPTVNVWVKRPDGLDIEEEGR